MQLSICSSPSLGRTFLAVSLPLMSRMLSSCMVVLGALSSVAMGSAKETFFFFPSWTAFFFFQTMVVSGSGTTLLLLGGDSLPGRHLLELMQSSIPLLQRAFLAQLETLRCRR